MLHHFPSFRGDLSPEHAPFIFAFCLHGDLCCAYLDPDRSFHNIRASESVDRRTLYKNGQRRSADSEALKL